MKPCVMCHKEFDDAALDFLERCEPCFREYITLEDKPNLGVPFSKKIDHNWPIGS